MARPSRAEVLRWSLAAATGALFAASLPPHGHPALAWVATAPLLAAARSAGRPRAALRLGLVAGAVMMALGYPWMIGLLATFAELDLWLCVLLFAAFCAWTAVPFALWAALVAGTAERRAWPLWAALTLPGLWWSWPAVFPFTPLLGLGQAPAFIQAAELGGAALIEALAALCSAAAVAALSVRGRARAGWGALALAIPALCFVLGSWRISAIDARPARTVRFGLVQPNIPLLWSDRQAKLERLRGPSAEAAAQGAEVIVWPENLYPWQVPRQLRRDFEDDDRILLRHALPTIVGAGSSEDEAEFGYNSAFLLAGEGEVLARYDKVLLVPLGEEIPLVDPTWAKAQIPAMAHNLAGPGPGRFAVPTAGGPLSLGPLICYEDVFAGYARAVAGQPGGVEAFVNLTNDTWFGASAEPWQHLALAQLRSVEHRIPMVRAVNSGPSAVIDRAGRIAAATALRPARLDAPAPPEVLVAEAAIGESTAAAPTIYARGGWLFVHVCQLVALAAAALTLRRRR